MPRKNQRGPGKPRGIESAEKMAELVDLYISKNISDNQDGNISPPTDYDFCQFAGIGLSTLNDYLREEDTYKGYSAAFKKLIGYRENYFLSAGLKNPKLAGVTNFALKQRKNGGYEDRPTVQVEARELTIKTGEGMPKDSFS